jgi:hypothetical protein
MGQMGIDSFQLIYRSSGPRDLDKNSFESNDRGGPVKEIRWDRVHALLWEGIQFLRPAMHALGGYWVLDDEICSSFPRWNEHTW